MEKAPEAILLLLLFAPSGAVALNATDYPGADEFHVGVILDLGSLVGKEARTSISLAVEDFYAAYRNYSTRLVLHVRDSRGNNFQAASAALDLINNYNVKAIIGPQKSSEACFLKDIAYISEIPVISFTATSPSLTSDNNPYFLRATINDSMQVNSIASLIKYYGWREVVPIYVDTDYGRSIIPDLLEALQGNDARVPYQSILPQSATSEQITQELYKLMTMQTRVFVVHMTSSMASVLFTKAKEVGMMDKGYVWIVTFGVASLIGSLNPSVLEAMNGALGVQVYVRLLSRIVLIIWLFFLLVLTSSYTASLTSMLTVQQLQPIVTDVHELLKNGEYVGYQRGSYVKGLLEELGFHKSKLRQCSTTDDFRDALSRGSNNGGISAFVDEIPYIKLFLAKHCEGYTMIGPIYKTAGFGYAFQKESPLRGDISKAILNITGGDTIIQIEKKWIGDQNKCQNVGPVTISGSLTFESFKGLFILTGVASTSSLLIALVIYFYKNKEVQSGIGDAEQDFPQELKGNTIEEEKEQEETGAKGTQNMNLQNSTVKRSASIVIPSRDRATGARVVPISGSARF